MRLSNSFQARIACVLILLLLVVIGALYFAVKVATGAAVQAQAREELDIGGRVFGRLLESRSRQLHDAVQVLAADFGFKEAVSSGDEETIRSALGNSGARINAGAVMLLGMDGKLQVSTAARVGSDSSARLAELMQEHQRNGGQGLLQPIDDDIYLLVEANVTAPIPIARVVMGFRLDADFASEMRELTHLDMSLVATQAGKPDIWLSTLPGDLEEALRSEIKTRDGDILRIGEQRYMGRRLVLSSGADYQVLLLLHKSLEQAQEAFAPLDRDILLIALCALLGSLAGALLLARSVSQPVRQLALATRRIGEGDYQSTVELHRSDELGQLAGAIDRMREDIAERERQLAHNALHDSLTGLPNRALALDRLGSAITAARPTALLHLGIGNFRAVNEACGPGGGDLALQQICRRLQATLRPGDSLARLVADEFLLLLEGADRDSAVAAADKLQQLLLRPLRIGSLDVAIDSRIGIACYPTDGGTPDELLRRASIAMQDAAQSPGHLQLYQQGRDDAPATPGGADPRPAPRRRAWRAGVALPAQARHRRRPVLQAEALLRWQHRHLGMVSPGEFIPLAERTGSIQSLTAWVIEEVLRQLQEWAGGARSAGLAEHLRRRPDEPRPGRAGVGAAAQLPRAPRAGGLRDHRKRGHGRPRAGAPRTRWPARAGHQPVGGRFRHRLLLPRAAQEHAGAGVEDRPVLHPRAGRDQRRRGDRPLHHRDEPQPRPQGGRRGRRARPQPAPARTLALRHRPGLPDQPAAVGRRLRGLDRPATPLTPRRGALTMNRCLALLLALSLPAAAIADQDACSPPAARPASKAPPAAASRPGRCWPATARRASGATAFATRVETGDYRLDAAGVAASWDNRVELSYARQRFDLGTLARDLSLPENTLSQDVVGLKVRLFGDLIYDPLPQVSLGLQYKRQKDFLIPPWWAPGATKTPRATSP